MSKDFLKKIVAHKKDLLKRKVVFHSGLKKNTQGSQLTRYHLFKKQICREGQINLIAEVKKASPSKGLIRKKFDPLALALQYDQAGAAAISVLTEDKYFLGKPEYIRTISDHVALPVLAKDFFIDEVQISEAFQMRAGAILLIVAILSDEELKRFIAVAAGMDMDCLVEVHDEQELDRAIQAGAEIIGINNRDLHTFEVDLAVSERLIPRIPKDRVIVAESGIKTRDDVQRLEAAGAHAVLIGETILKEEDVVAKIRELMGR